MVAFVNNVEEGDVGGREVVRGREEGGLGLKGTQVRPSMAR